MPTNVQTPANEDWPELSIVSPVFLAESSLEPLVEAIDSAVRSTDIGGYEVILVEDGSPDNSWLSIAALCERFPHVRGIRLSRNFGQHYAITAGLQAAVGNWVLVMDCDLQDDPKYIPDLYAKAAAGFDVVYTIKEERKHRGIKNLLSKWFHRLVNLLVADQRQRTNANVGNYSILSRAAVNAFLSLSEYHRHYLGVLRWIGFKSTSIRTAHRDRLHGETSYTLWRLVREAVNAITSQSDRLLYASILLGFAFMVTAVLAAIYIVIRYFVSGFQEGWASVMVLMLLSTGVILLCLGVIGVYLGKVFEQTKSRPLYLVRERLNFSDASHIETVDGLVSCDEEARRFGQP